MRRNGSLRRAWTCFRTISHLGLRARRRHSTAYRWGRPYWLERRRRMHLLPEPPPFAGYSPSCYVLAAVFRSGTGGSQRPPRRRNKFAGSLALACALADLAFGPLSAYTHVLVRFFAVWPVLAERQPDCR